MAEEKSSYVNTGNVSGTGIAIGQDVQATVTINQQTQQELLDLIKQLQQQIQDAQLPEGAKAVLLEKAVPEMTQAVQSEDPKTGFQRGLERVDEQLQGAGAVAEHASGIVDTVAKIAKTIGIPLLHAAPYIAALI
jgi:O6-methylguanine-DNA--protein-cysteine methyltransferase